MSSFFRFTSDGAGSGITGGTELEATSSTSDPWVEPWSCCRAWLSGGGTDTVAVGVCFFLGTLLTVLKMRDSILQCDREHHSYLLDALSWSYSISHFSRHVHISSTYFHFSMNGSRKDITAKLLCPFFPAGAPEPLGRLFLLQICVMLIFPLCGHNRTCWKQMYTVTQYLHPKLFTNRGRGREKIVHPLHTLTFRSRSSLSYLYQHFYFVYTF